MPIDDDTPATKQFSLRNTIDETNSKAEIDLSIEYDEPGPFELKRAPGGNKFIRTFNLQDQPAVGSKGIHDTSKYLDVRKQYRQPLNDKQFNVLLKDLIKSKSYGFTENSITDAHKTYFDRLIYSKQLPVGTTKSDLELFAYQSGKEIGEKQNWEYFWKNLKSKNKQFNIDKNLLTKEQYNSLLHKTLPKETGTYTQIIDAKNLPGQPINVDKIRNLLDVVRSNQKVTLKGIRIPQGTGSIYENLSPDHISEFIEKLEEKGYITTLVGKQKKGKITGEEFGKYTTPKLDALIKQIEAEVPTLPSPQDKLEPPEDLISKEITDVEKLNLEDFGKKSVIKGGDQLLKNITEDVKRQESPQLKTKSITKEFNLSKSAQERIKRALTKQEKLTPKKIAKTIVRGVGRDIQKMIWSPFPTKKISTGLVWGERILQMVPDVAKYLARRAARHIGERRVTSLFKKLDNIDTYIEISEVEETPEFRTRQRRRKDLPAILEKEAVPANLEELIAAGKSRGAVFNIEKFIRSARKLPVEQRQIFAERVYRFLQKHTTDVGYAGEGRPLKYNPGLPQKLYEGLEEFVFEEQLTRFYANEAISLAKELRPQLRPEVYNKLPLVQKKALLTRTKEFQNRWVSKALENWATTKGGSSSNRNMIQLERRTFDRNLLIPSSKKYSSIRYILEKSKDPAEKEAARNWFKRQFIK